MKTASAYFLFMLIGLTPLWSVIETPDNLEVGMELAGPLGYYYSYPGDQARFVNVRIVNNRFECYFLEADKKTIVEPEWSRAIIQYESHVRRGLARQTTVMHKVDGRPLLSAKRIIQPPHRYWIRVILQNKEDEEATNNYNAPASERAERYAFDRAFMDQLPQQDPDNIEQPMNNNL